MIRNRKRNTALKAEKMGQSDISSIKYRCLPRHVFSKQMRLAIVDGDEVDVVDTVFSGNFMVDVH